MTKQDAFDILKRENLLLKTLPTNSPLWKKAVLEFFDSPNIHEGTKRALVTIAGSIEDDEVMKKYFALFATEANDELRKYMVDALKDNFHEKAVEMQMPLLGLKERVFDRYVRQIVSQNMTAAIKFFIEKKPIRAGLFIAKLKNVCLNDANTFMRMNAAIILRNLGEKRAIPELEKRLIVEKKLYADNPGDVGLPYVIREMERTIAFLKERA